MLREVTIQAVETEPISTKLQIVSRKGWFHMWTNSDVEVKTPLGNNMFSIGVRSKLMGLIEDAKTGQMYFTEPTNIVFVDNHKEANSGLGDLKVA